MKEYAIGLDIGGTDIKTGIVESSGKMISHMETPTECGKPSKVILGNIRDVIKRLLDSAGMSTDDIKGIGAGTPGLVDNRGRIVAGAPNFRCWAGTDLGGFLRREFGTDVVVENDVTALVMGEAIFGNGKPFSNFISLAFGTGLGGGVIIDGNVYRGKNGYAAEFGHIRVNPAPDAPKCNCGLRGCLETYASAVGIRRMLKEWHSGARTVLSADSTAKQVYDLAAKGRDALALRIVGEIGYRLGVGLGILVNIFDPEAVILGGGISNAGRIFMESFQKSYRESVMEFYLTHKVKFLPAKLGKEGGIVGTASLILGKSLESCSCCKG